MRALKKAKSPNRRKGKSALFDKKQKGYTLVEIILATALISASSILVMDKNITDLEHQKARELGVNLFDYGNAVRQYIAFNPDSPDIPETSPLTGVGWLQDSSDPKCIGATGDKTYLPCTFPKKLFGDVQITTSKTKSPDGTISVNSKVSAIKTGETVRPDLSGIAAMVAKAGTVIATDGTAQTTYGSFMSNPLDGIITIDITNDPELDIWVRVDKPVVRDSLTFHADGGPEKREIKNVSKVSSLDNEGLLFSAGLGSVTIGSNTEIEHELKVAGQTTLSILETTGDVDIGGKLTVDQGADITGKTDLRGNTDIHGSATVTGNVRSSTGYFYTGNDTTFRMQPHGISNLNRVNATRVDVADLNVTGNHLMIQETVTLGNTCGSSLEGAIGRDENGKILSCKSGFWIGASVGFGDCKHIVNTGSPTGSDKMVTSTCPAAHTLIGMACATIRSGDTVDMDSNPHTITNNSVTCARLGSTASVTITTTAICCPL